MFCLTQGDASSHSQQSGFVWLAPKFNISFDNGGQVSVCADTNDIAFYAVRVPEGAAVPAGIYFRVQLCGITDTVNLLKTVAC